MEAEIGQLSLRQKEVLREAANGGTNAEIASRLGGISSHTVKIHLEHISRTLGTKGRTSTVVHAIREGIIEPTPPILSPEDWQIVTLTVGYYEWEFPYERIAESLRTQPREVENKIIQIRHKLLEERFQIAGAAEITPNVPREPKKLTAKVELPEPLINQRDLKIIQAVANGEGDKIIAKDEGIQLNTVRGRFKHIYGKLGLERHSRSALVAWALNEGLIAKPEGFGLTAQPSNRQSEVLALLSQGLTNKEIAKALLISPTTVRYHIGHLMDVQRAANRANLVALMHE